MTWLPETPVIPRVEAIARLHRVPVPHTNDAVYALTGDGRSWIAKRESDMGSEALVAEAVGWLLGREIGVPVPDAAFCDDPAERSWLSAWVQDARHWHPSLADRVANPDEMGAIMALDAWIWNEARHRRNLLAAAQGDSSFRIWAIDADEALVGHVADFMERGLDVPSVHNHVRGLSLSMVAGGAHAAAGRAARVPLKRLAAMVDAACDVGGEPRASDLLGALAARAGALPIIVEHYLRRLEALR